MIHAVGLQTKQQGTHPTSQLTVTPNIITVSIPSKPFQNGRDQKQSGNRNTMQGSVTVTVRKQDEVRKQKNNAGISNRNSQENRDEVRKQKQCRDQ